MYIYIYTHIVYLHNIGPCGTDKIYQTASGYEVNGDFKRLQALKAASSSAEFQQDEREWFRVDGRHAINWS